MHRPHERILLSLVVTGLTAGCLRSARPATLAAAHADSAGTRVITIDRSLRETALGGPGSANHRAEFLFDIDSMEHPVSTAFLPEGGVAILDRVERTVSIVDPTGRVIRTLARQGDGPGELQVPAGIVALGDELFVLQSHPMNVLTRWASDGQAHAIVPSVRGDWNGWLWQRPDIGLEFPIQSSPEVWSRRLRAFTDTSLAVLVGGTEGDTAADAVVLQFGRDLRLLDTLATLPAVRFTTRQNNDRRGGERHYQDVWGVRPVWAAGVGRLALGRSDRAEVVVWGRDSSEAPTIVRWPAVEQAVTEKDREQLGEQIVAVTVASSPEAAANASKMSVEDRRAMLGQFLATFDFTPFRPELVALFIADSCLWLAGFDPADQPDGAAHEWVVVHLTDSSAVPRVVTFGSPRERVVAIGPKFAATIELEPDGFRRVRIYRTPVCSPS